MKKPSEIHDSILKQAHKNAMQDEAIVSAEISYVDSRTPEERANEPKFITTSTEIAQKFKLKYCPKCVQMTNHLNGVCQKCNSHKQPIVNLIEQQFIEATNKWYKSIGKDHHKDNDCHWYISKQQRYSYGKEPELYYWLIEHTGYITEFSHIGDTKDEVMKAGIEFIENYIK